MPFKMTGDSGNGGGSAPSDIDAFIFDKWGPFATDQGFVANRAPVVGTAPSREYWTHQGTIGSPQEPFIYLDTEVDSVNIYTGHTSIDVSGTQEAFDQPNNPNNGPNAPMRVNNANGPWSSHYLFSDAGGNYIHAVMQTAARRWRHMLTGIVPAANKYGTWVGGTYTFGLEWTQGPQISNPYSSSPDGTWGIGCMNNRNNTQNPLRHGALHCEGLRANVDWYVNNANAGLYFNDGGGDVNPQTNGIGTFFPCGVGITVGGGLKRLGASLISRNVVLAPVTLLLDFSFSGSFGWGAVGTLPDVYFINMRGLSPAQEVVVGSDTYRVFPLVNSDTVSTVNGEEYSGYEGLAYRVIP